MRIQTSEVDLATPSGPMRTVIVAPLGEGRFPGIVLFSDIFQVTGPTRRIAEQLAGFGHVVAMPEIFHELLERGTELPFDDAGSKRGGACKTGKSASAYHDDARAALNHLAAHPACTGRLGTMGFCVGGHLALRAALQPDVRAAACFQATDVHSRSLGTHGADTIDRLADARGEVLFFWGRQDPHIPLEARRLIHAAAETAGLTFTWHEVNAPHAAMRDEGSNGRYDPQVSRTFWDLSLDLYRRRLLE